MAGIVRVAPAANGAFCVNTVAVVAGIVAALTGSVAAGDDVANAVVAAGSVNRAIWHPASTSEQISKIGYSHKFVRGGLDIAGSWIFVQLYLLQTQFPFWTAVFQWKDRYK